MGKMADLSIGGKVVASFPILEGTEIPNAIDIRQMLDKTDMVTYDPGFFSTASCKSKITYIDGDRGILKYRGEEVANLIGKYDFPSVVYALLNGNFPDQAQANAFRKTLEEHATLHAETKKVITNFPSNAHPMSVLIAGFASLEPLCKGSDIEMATSAIAKVPSMVAAIYRTMKGKSVIDPPKGLDYSSRFVYTMFGEENPTISKSMDTIFTLHADHEQNASTSSVRASASAGANLFCCLCSGVATLSGPAHGGANEAVMKMIDAIEKTENIPKFILKAKDKDDPFRLMGFGHRVYKNYDPRAKVLKSTSSEVLDKLGHRAQSEKLAIAKQLEKIALEDQYFIERKLYPNVDFYSGIILDAIGIPVSMFTPMFALARTSGWAAQYVEAKHDPEQKIYRPRQLYLGA